jgi:hypothetical protein
MEVRAFIFYEKAACRKLNKQIVGESNCTLTLIQKFQCFTSIAILAATDPIGLFFSLLRHPSWRINETIAVLLDSNAPVPAIFFNFFQRSAYP